MCGFNMAELRADIARQDRLLLNSRQLRHLGPLTNMSTDLILTQIA